MSITISRLTYEMEDARRNIAVCETEIEHYQKMLDYWKEHKKAFHATYYRAKAELKTLTDKKAA